MNINEIEILLHKYFEGISTTDEEKILKGYFSSEEVAPHLDHYRAMFGYFESEKQHRLGDEFDAEIMQRINQAPAVSFYRTNRFWYYFTGVAASLLFIMALLIESQQTGNNQNLAGTDYTREEAQQAYHQTRIALAFVSEKISQGTEPLSEMGRFETTATKLDELGKFNQGLKNLNQQTENIEKINSGVENMSKISKFNIVIKP
ncbi:MAG: hypothetical protein ACLFPE_15330 [Bacteroidales bacterium]